MLLADLEARRVAFEAGELESGEAHAAIIGDLEAAQASWIRHGEGKKQRAAGEPPAPEGG